MPTAPKRATARRRPTSSQSKSTTTAPATSPLFDVTAHGTPAGAPTEADLQFIPLDQLELGKNPRRDISEEGITRLARMLMTSGQTTPVIAWRNRAGTVLVYAGQRRLLAARRSVELAGTEGFEDLKPVLGLAAVVRKRKPTKDEIQRIQAHENQNEALSRRDLQDQFLDVWKELVGLGEDARLAAACDALGHSAVRARNLLRECTLPDEIRYRVSENPGDGEISIRMATRLADMHTVAPGLATAVGERMSTRELHHAATHDLGAFVHRTLVESPQTYALRLEEGAVLDAGELISDARPHLDEAALATLSGVLGCERRAVLTELELLSAKARHLAAQVRVDANIRDRAANGNFAWVHTRGLDYADVVWVVDPTFAIDLVHGQLHDVVPSAAPARHDAYFKTSDVTSDDLEAVAEDDAIARAQARERHELAVRANLGLGHDVRGGVLALTEEQMQAMRAIVCHLVARDYAHVLAYGAGWSDRDRQQPTSDDARFVPRSMDTIVQAEVAHALEDPDPVRGIVHILCRWASAFLLDPAGVTRTRDLGAERMNRRLREALPAGESPLRDAVWQLLRPVLSPHLVELNKQEFLPDDAQHTSTVDLAAHAAAVELAEIDLGEAA